jgi:gas vesicle protein
MKTLILAGAILAAGGLVAASVAGLFAEDPGKRLRRECESILRQVSRSFSDPKEVLDNCILIRAGLK